ncbi:hypothetical protein E0485_15215 [Paenibacillus albiflavus]|uniref:Phage tail protein n=1 Tax=Paenibacillus albiflavus TaxID=2545760 RepID=A0A4R4E8Q3_9BACL|nr:hypothetical protein [Paenibacillus albiflavus]TCZ76184.1 hypothetical protein E0485_15215 [Paenibacillus albiflavus]
MNFKRFVEVTIGDQKFANNSFTIEFSIPFTDESTPDECEIKIYNLTESTIARFSRSTAVVINAGYEGDVGVTLVGTISKVATQFMGPDKITTINVIDGIIGSSVQKAYAKGTNGNYIIRDLAASAGIPIAKLVTKDVVFNSGYAVNGMPLDIIRKVARECGSKAYIDRGQLVVTPVSTQGSVLVLSPDTGLIGYPEPFEDERGKGYKLTSQFSHPVTKGSIVQLQSRIANAVLYVRAGKHTFNIQTFTTEMEAIY